MKVKVQLDRRYAEPEAAIYTAAMTGEVQQAVRLLSEESPQMLACCDGESVVLVEQTQLVRVYGAAKKSTPRPHRANFCCAGGCMSWNRFWIGGILCASPSRRSSTCALSGGWISALPAPSVCN